MLFILVMEILSILVKWASEEGQLQPLSTKQLKHRISLYVADEVIFLRTYPGDITLVLDMLQLFGKLWASKPMSKKAVFCRFDVMSTLYSLLRSFFLVSSLLLPCEFTYFPCKYIRLPLSLKKLTKPQV
jgi:hypothetical protein